ncbi:sodium-coupled monocarboxylate transporter 1-like [Mizuhopecten yessoensis]|uniref:Sodium-coupled monocarboxylate transporter 1 n=1 Tax=Mizuhopecten yessoensis TaxID=6573 RepID=A0A210PTZ3_MIZYE|nr:sodium-coupled monocarboxylate transporter 1-like [Mizuhopecten yessoensis]OWF39948.1 Sodium-coupled monocarboxylate transporter 1 [Mizuhopecten yessoensis]
MATFTTFDYCLFVAVLLVSFFIGLYYMLKEKFAKQESTSDDILMGGRDMPVFPVAMSLVASYMSAITVLGVPTEMYVFGTEYYLVAFSGLLTYPITCFVFLPFFHNLGLSSAYQYLELRFNSWTRYLAALIFAIEMVLYMAVVLYAPALALNQVTGLSLSGSILSVGAVVTFYTSMGGLRAVLWTDTFQTFVVVGGLVGIIAIGCTKFGGIGEVWNIAQQGGRIQFFNFDPSPFTRCTFWGLIVGSFIGQLTIYGANQTMLQRYMSISNVKNAQIALFVSLPATILLITLVCLSGLVIYAEYHDCDPLLDGKLISRDQLLPYYVMESLGGVPGIPGLFVACIFSAALSSISSCLNALSITLLEDLLKPFMKYCGIVMKPSAEAKTANILGAVGGLVVIGFAFLSSLLGSTVLQIMISVLGMAGGPLLGLFLMGMFFPCVNAKGAITGMIVCTVVIFWIVVGSFVYQVPMPTLPFETDGCDIADGVTYAMNKFVMNTPDISIPREQIGHSQAAHGTETDWSGPMVVYRLSFLWYPIVAIWIALVVGILVSWLTGWQSEKIDPKLVYPVSEKLCCFLPYSVRRKLNCFRLWKYNVRGMSDVLSDDEEEEEFSKLKTGKLETARLLPPMSRRMDSFEAEVDESGISQIT